MEFRADGHRLTPTADLRGGPGEVFLGGELGASDYGRSPRGGGRGEVFRIAGDDSGAIE